MVGICINLSHMQNWFGGDFTQVIPLIQQADAMGLDQVSLAEHVVMTEAGAAAYPYGDYYQNLNDPWPEPIVYLAALAGATSRIALSTGILIAPLRPAVLLAKQLATLDVLSRGRVIAGLGVGWQREEYDAAGVPWIGRFARLEEQIHVCRALWRDTPANFAGETVAFQGIHAWPKPVKPDGVPIWLGVGLGDRNITRIVALADGWLPLETAPAKLSVDIARLHAACCEHGRDPATLGVRANMMISGDGGGLADTAHRLVEAGVTVLQVYPGWFCDGPEACIDLFGKLIALKRTLS